MWDQGVKVKAECCAYSILSNSFSKPSFCKSRARAIWFDLSTTRVKCVYRTQKAYWRISMTYLGDQTNLVINYYSILSSTFYTCVVHKISADLVFYTLSI